VNLKIILFDFPICLASPSESEAIAALLDREGPRVNAPREPTDEELKENPQLPLDSPFEPQRESPTTSSRVA
jgi:hypothetical protein